MKRAKRKFRRKISQFKKLKIGTRAVNLAMFIIGWVIVIALAWLYVIGFRTETIISDNAMSPTYEEEAVIRINRVIYKFSSPRRFDTVALQIGETSSNVYYVRRIVGLPGETVRIENGTIYIDDVELDYPYNEETIENAGAANRDILLDDNEYFVLCDNYNVRMDDSRSANIGVISSSQIIGRVN